MRLSLLFLLLTGALTLGEPGAESPWKVDLFQGETGGYRIYRIPALIVTQKGTLLAFCAARNDFGDWADIDIAMRRSTDGGTTWETARVIAEAGTGTADNPTPIVDGRTGSIHFLYQVNYARIFYMHSDDEGQTFTKPVDITYAVEQFRPEYAWTVVAPGPGHAVQLRSGRLLVPVWLSPDHSHRPSKVSVIYSDDGGSHWQRGEILPEGPRNPSESVAVELDDGRVMLNIRNESDTHRRAVSFSRDGATGWSRPAFNEGLYEPVCMASLVRLSGRAAGEKSRIVFANPDSHDDLEAVIRQYNMRPRNNLTVRLSYDEGKSWSVSKLLEAGRTGYSDLACGGDGSIYCFYERGVNDENNLVNRNLTFARFSLRWLTDGKDSFTPNPAPRLRDPGPTAP